MEGGGWREEGGWREGKGYAKRFSLHGILGEKPEKTYMMPWCSAMENWPTPSLSKAVLTSLHSCVLVLNLDKRVRKRIRK